MLEAVSNVSEGRDVSVIAAIGQAFRSSASLLDVHSDPDHHRSVFTVAGEQRPLADALVAGVSRASELIDLRRHEGVHPRIGVVDLVPLVPLRSEEMERAAAAALLVAAGGSILMWQTHTWFAWLVIAAVQIPIALAWPVLRRAAA